MLGLLSRRKRSAKTDICSAVVVAAGSARRMEGIDKVMTPLGGVPILVRTLRVFQNCEQVHEIVIVTREDLLADVAKLCKAYNLDKVSGIVVGGTERVLSVQAGLRQVRKDAALIAIQDGARPFLSQQVLGDVLHQAKLSGAAAPAIAVTDTIKRVDAKELICDTVDRSCLRAVQTPQVFQADLIRAAIRKAVDDGAPVTDDCSAVERLGMKVVLTPGERENIKVTTPFDMILGQAILEARGE
ncbi:MAG: 2-C-methyl-D-erythritol 4-phosphate cytidylyltransferase [Oscillospiraceae bacterium]|nr:2-C-methyl-D-erythritol 4-phosphate cytidylyltransferase [Oscillospiraceae bacterium]